MVGGTLTLIVGVNPWLRRKRRAGNVRPVRIEPTQRMRNYVLIQPLAPALSRSESLFPPPVLISPEVLVAAAPQDQRSAVSDSRHRIGHLPLHAANLHVVFRIGRARKREVLPHDDAELVAHVVEVIRLNSAAAPHPEHV